MKILKMSAKGYGVHAEHVELDVMAYSQDYMKRYN